ncbi:MAG: hypothetical protein ACR2OC_05920 [Solirubrobacterales bacterium]
MPLFPFAQFELPGRVGIADGRYLVRNAKGDDDDVIVVSSVNAPASGSRRRRRPRAAGSEPEAKQLPASRVTVVRARSFVDENGAEAWLAGVREDNDARDAFSAEALALLNRSLHIHRAATMDPYVNEVSAHTPSATRVGYGDGDRLAAGQWTEALDAPPDPGRRRRRIAALLPQERLAAVLGGRDTVAACETLVLRARLDHDHDRPREAALQLEPAVQAMLAEIAPGARDDQMEDITALREASESLLRARKQALAGDLNEQAATDVAATLAVCERILRRRRIITQG